MPNRPPSRSRTSAASSVSWAARAPSRSIRSWLVAFRYQAHSRAAGPEALKYSALAENVTGRSSISGRKMESSIDRWLAARMAPPEAGTCSSPVTFGRQIVCRNGPARMRDTWYCTDDFLLLRGLVGGPRPGRSGYGSITIARLAVKVRGRGEDPNAERQGQRQR